MVHIRGKSAAATHLRCDSCGRMPEPQRLRLTVANVAAILPIELLVHAVVVNTTLPYLLKIALLAVTATALVIWVTEPSVRRVLSFWLHAPALSRRRTLHASEALWRVRVVLEDRPGSLKDITRTLARLPANILRISVHPIDTGVLDELVLATASSVREEDIMHALAGAGSRSTTVRPTTPFALEDGQTRALSLAARVAAEPAELRNAISELLSAHPVAGPFPGADGGIDGTVLKLPSSTGHPHFFTRPGEPFTPAESARAHRLAELAETAELNRIRSVT